MSVSPTNKRWILHRILWLFAFSYSNYCSLMAQSDKISAEDYIDQYINKLDETNNFDFNQLYDRITGLLAQPLNINEASRDDLQGLYILDDIKINSILAYRAMHGAFISEYELQAVPKLDPQDVKSLTPLITVAENNSLQGESIQDLIRSGRHEIFLRWSAVAEQQKGYTLNNAGEKRFLGDRNRLYGRYKYSKEDKISFGLTVDKDAGEEFFTGSNRHGFDFYSFHFYLRDYSQRLKQIALGDFSISFGQGLIMHNQFGLFKSAYVTDVKKGTRVIKPYTSVNEYNFFRGAAVTLRLAERIELSTFASSRRIDTNLLNDDVPNRPLVFSSIRQDGNHRTLSEIEDERTTRRTTAGSRLTYAHRRFRASANVLYDAFSREFRPRDRPYNEFRFRGKSLTNASIDFGYSIKNINAFGELAVSDNGAPAALLGALLSLSRKTDLSILYRNYAKDYQNLWADGFAETSNTTNERGLYVGLLHRINQQWQLAAYADHWHHPFKRFRVDEPSRGREYLLKLSYEKRDKIQTYIQYRYEKKQRNKLSSDTQIEPLITIILHRLRLNNNWQMTRQLSLSQRIELSFFDEKTKSSGILLYQDIKWKSMESPFAFSMRASYFNVSDFDARIYAYENDLINNFFIPFFNNQGFRSYLNLRYNWNYHVTTELRIARTHYLDIDVISSGNNRIDGNHRTDIKLQARLRF